ncbi:hypothetical protein BCT46_12740 [Vibrio sp. 10N.261.46.E8]|nr:hypothetical protein BH584_25000 [Vibrio sp. 10N.261.45.E1]PMJ25754.1 hypothetical protein BCU27_10280 [Vibrio sp. 10N.286.45.B6]PML84692.1 hypothetical protein BCT66_16905 [Vibrio sp. 10N.261.49.E11]PMM76250.1 hypothetical protein BCT48_25215 [Vibrio sp. 10N.261.46.F12]PMM83442.1 hypothetical protein BCT46_12740 [Vibrio sp. 10N.261.46.E8]PMN29052.1 hypothetical protein BCT34_18800 [Vibrio sp. 10N.261.45.E2]PMN45541.1 hypothetical protein BCT32_12500 [Vibrio sp. 10N.261.45.E11]PMN84387.1 
MQTITVKDYEVDSHTSTQANLLFLAGAPLFVPSTYLYYKLRTNKSISIKNLTSRLKIFINQVLTDNNDWSFKGDLKSKHELANKALFNIGDAYITGYLNLLFKGNCIFSDKYKKGGLKNSSMELHIDTLRDFYDFCFKFGFTSEKKDFSYIYKRYEKQQTYSLGFDLTIHNKYYNKDEFKAFIGYCTAKNKFLNTRNRLIFSLCYYCGLRPHELLKGANFSRKRLEKVINKKAKFNVSAELIVSGKGRGEGKLRKIIIPPEAYQKLKEYLYTTLPKLEKDLGKIIRNRIFVTDKGKELSDASYFTKLWEKTKHRYISNNTNISPLQVKLWKQRELYSTRHCFVTNLIIKHQKDGKGIDQIAIQEIMGHSSIETTFASYVYLAAIVLKSDELEKEAISFAEAAVRVKNNRRKQEGASSV